MTRVRSVHSIMRKANLAEIRVIIRVIISAILLGVFLGRARQTLTCTNVLGYDQVGSCLGLEDK